MLDIDLGLIQCMCTTSDCQRDGKITCQAENVCYVQVMPRPAPTVPATASPGPAAGSGLGTQTAADRAVRAAAMASSIVRGCIDDRTPLLCENRRPLTYNGPWPVLLCCKENWCNRDVQPTLPPWVDDVRGTWYRLFDRTGASTFIKLAVDQRLAIGIILFIYLFAQDKLFMNGIKCKIVAFKVTALVCTAIDGKFV